MTTLSPISGSAAPGLGLDGNPVPAIRGVSAAASDPQDIDPGTRAATSTSTPAQPAWPQASAALSRLADQYRGTPFGPMLQLLASLFGALPTQGAGARTGAMPMPAENSIAGATTAGTGAAAALVPPFEAQPKTGADNDGAIDDGTGSVIKAGQEVIPALPPLPMPAPPPEVKKDTGGVQYDNTLRGNQQALIDALQRHDASRQAIDCGLNVQGIESSDGITHDNKKDWCTDGSRNYSPFNMNADQLGRNGVKIPFEQLNMPRTPSDWDKVAEAFLACYNNEGETAFLTHLRNGYGADNPVAFQQYMNGFQAQQALREQRGLGVRDTNVDVPYQ